MKISKMLPEHLDPAIEAKLKAYQALLLKWQKAINLVSPSTLDKAWHRHFHDSLQLASFVPRETSVADLGSGAGFPGLVLAIARPDLKVHLIESDERKGQFLKTVSRETQTVVQIHTARVEKLLPDLQVDIITARAFASLESICDYVTVAAEKNPALTMLLLKGRDAAQEIKEARRSYNFDVETIPSQTEEGAFILKVQNLQKTL